MRTIYLLELFHHSKMELWAPRPVAPPDAGAFSALPEATDRRFSDQICANIENVNEMRLLRGQRHLQGVNQL